MGSQKRRNAKPAAAPVVPEVTPAVRPAAMTGQRLAELLLDPDRQDVVVVVSLWHEHPESQLDPCDIAAKLDGIATVVTIHNGPETFELGRLLPAHANVFHNAARAYPVGTGWQKDPYAESRLFIVQSPANVLSTTADLVRDAEKRVELAAAAHWSTQSAQAEAPAASVQTVGTIKQPSSDGLQAIAWIGGHMAVVHKEHHAPNIPLNWLLADGQELRGRHRRSDNSFHIPRAHPPVSVNRTYASGSVALALVTAVRPDRATVTLYPGHSAEIPLELITSNDIDTADDLLSVGEVVAVRVAQQQGRVVLSMLDVDDDEDIVAPPALLVGGTPWLELGRNLYDDDPRLGSTAAPAAAPGAAPEAGAGDGLEPSGVEPALLPGTGFAQTIPDGSVPEPTAAVTVRPAGAPGSGGGALPQALLRVDALRAENSILKSEATTLRDEIGHLRRQLANGTAGQAQLAKLSVKLEAEREEARGLAADLNDAQSQSRDLQRKLRDADGKLRELKTKNRNASKSMGKPTLRASREWFASDEDYVRFVVQQAWAQFVPASEKATFPLGAYGIGEDFYGSLVQTPEDKRDKALRAVVDLLANRAEALRKRDAHPLRTGSASSTAPVVRSGSGGVETCYRLYVEEKSSAARRLHYWKGTDGSVELSRIVPHDDMEP